MGLSRVVGEKCQNLKRVARAAFRLNDSASRGIIINSFNLIIEYNLGILCMKHLLLLREIVWAFTSYIIKGKLQLYHV